MTGLTAGLGLKPEHYDEALACRSAGMWFEVHAENYMVDGGPRRRWLETVRREHPLSLHGVSLSLAGSDPLDPSAVAGLTRLVRELEPVLVSEHLAWSHFEGAYLRPAAVSAEHRSADAGLRQRVSSPRCHRTTDRDRESVALPRTRRARLRRGRVSDPPRPSHRLPLLLDINNVFVSARNVCTSAERYVDAFPAEHVVEVHLAGHRLDPDPRTTSFDRFARRCRRAGGLDLVRAIRCARRESADPRRMGRRAACLRRADGRT